MDWVLSVWVNTWTNSRCKTAFYTWRWCIIAWLSDKTVGVKQTLLGPALLRQTVQTFPLESDAAIRGLSLGNAPSLLLALAGRSVRLGGAVAAFPQQRGAENADDAQVEDEAEDQHPDGPQEGGHRRVGHERRPPRRHVCDHALHLEVGPHHGADVEELVAVACETRFRVWNKEAKIFIFRNCAWLNFLST